MKFYQYMKDVKMYKIKEITDKIEKFAPLETCADWDNSGWQINLGKDECKKIMTALTVTEDVVKQAIEGKCDLIISHHPIIFEPLNKIEPGIILDLINNGIQAYSAHTNLDVAKGGTTDTLGKKCGFDKLTEIDGFLSGTKCNIDIEEFAEIVKKNLELESMKIININDKKRAKSICFCAGGGGSEIAHADNNGYDLFVTGEVKFHEAFEAGDCVVFEVGHFDSEKYVGEIFKKILGNKYEIIEANEKRPWIFY